MMDDKVMLWLLARFPRWLVFSFVGILGTAVFVSLATIFMLFAGWYIQVPKNLATDSYNLKALFGALWFGAPLGAAIGNILFFDTYQRKSKDDES